MLHITQFARPLLAILISTGVMTTPLPTFAAGDAKPVAVQAVKDGLSVTVVSEHDRYAVSQTPAFDVTFTNQRDSAVRLSPGLSMYDMWTIVAQETSTGASYSVHLTAEYRRRVREITTLGAKESKTVHLDFSKFQFIHREQEQKENPLSKLPAGKYRLNISIKFEPVFDIPESSKPATWVGEMKTDALTFEIAG